MIRIVALLTLALGADATSGRADGTNGSLDQECGPAVRAVVEGYHRAVDAKDLGWLDAHTVADADAVLVGTAADEYWVGWQSARPAHEQMLRSVERTVTRVSDVRIKSLGDGSVAVASFLLHVEGAAQGEPFTVRDVRATMVLERRSGEWLVAARHTSVAAVPSVQAPQARPARVLSPPRVEALRAFEVFLAPTQVSTKRAAGLVAPRD